jgi:superfamily II DNA/RNA helicase
VVQDEFQRDVLFNELIRNDCNRTPGFNSIITVTDLLASIDGNDAKFTLLQTYIFDNIDQIQDKVVGPRLEELLIRLPKKKQYIFTATNFSNIESFARKFKLLTFEI